MPRHTKTVSTIDPRKNGKYNQSRKKLEKYKDMLDVTAAGAKEYINQFLLLLLEIKEQELYFYDQCRSMREFIMKNGYHEKMALRYGTVDMRMNAIAYARGVGLKKREYEKISYIKLIECRTQGVKSATEVLKLTSKPLNVIKYTIGLERNPLTGRIMPKDTPKRRPDSTLFNMDVEVPNKHKEMWEKEFVRISNKCNAVVRTFLSEDKKRKPGRPKQIVQKESVDLT